MSPAKADEKQTDVLGNWDSILLSIQADALVRRAALQAELDTLISEEFHQRDTVEFGAEFADRDRRRARIQRLDDLHLRLDDLDDELADLGELQAASVPVAELELVLRSAAAECRTAAFPSEYFR